MYSILGLTVGLSGHKLTISQGRSVMISKVESLLSRGERACWRAHVHINELSYKSGMDSQT